MFSSIHFELLVDFFAHFNVYILISKHIYIFDVHFQLNFIMTENILCMISAL